MCDLFRNFECRKILFGLFYVFVFIVQNKRAYLVEHALCNVFIDFNFKLFDSAVRFNAVRAETEHFVNGLTRSYFELSGRASRL